MDFVQEHRGMFVALLFVFLGLLWFGWVMAGPTREEKQEERRRRIQKENYDAILKARNDRLMLERGKVPFAELVSTLSGVRMTQPRISDLLRGNRRPSLQEVEMIAAALRVTPGWLAFGGKEVRALHPRTQTETPTLVPTPAEKAAAERRRGRA